MTATGAHDGQQTDPGGGRSFGNGRYQLRSLLGEGGMASVHLAYDTVLDRPVAVKTLHTELGREQSFRERFRREAQAVAKLNHTNIVSVYDSGEEPGTDGGAATPYIVMEYVEGKPLRQVLDEDVAEHGAMPTEKALKITADVLAALAASHEMGLVHRDIKPGNVMVTRRGVVKVMDFGIARALQSGVTSMTQTGMVVGTPQYLSPEQALGRGVDARSDLYSVGCLLFELLTGRLPFDGDSPLSIAYQHVQEEPPAPSSVNRAVPPAVDALVARALRKNPADRFPTAETMQEEAQRVASAAKGGNTPLVIGEGPRAHGAGGGEGISSAVFPRVQADLGTPPPQVQTPYRPQGGYPTPHPQQGAPHHPMAGPMGPSTPPPGPMGHSTPPPGPMGHSTPPPGPVPHQPHPAPAPMAMSMGPGGPGGHGMHTPPPAPAFNPQPQNPQSGGNGCSTALIIVGSVIGVLILIVVIIVSAVANSDDTKTGSSGGSTGSTGYEPDDSGDSGGTGEEDSRDTGGSSGGSSDGNPARPAVETSDCTEASESYIEEDAVSMPEFTLKDAASVRACIKAAGWKYEEKTIDEDLWGKGTVIEQSPAKYKPLGDGDTVTIWVSTGKAAE
ncbi:protein kinase [Streptomyces sp. NPDC059506]|uniref:Stk1 family PASTA domain-containing Ser/Thr kinase n=1 Tax=Streptomyces TaxID=1883 RepID=UPI00367DDCBD